ncbi:hypothetical protein SAMN05428988_0146 [Chitinophaga sp. YR573]|uniref:hypothetical protein n=1 Tax=Chitinophaga sp. YR573 TaxID=1881040 RepID=UPI0008AAECAC|nr:hypothetical protein [Chitinophaga sp. YR573]SEV88808.1 hypothetical protein SAMN05428988_0146 [Chitinophaga sp. YR573]
MNKYFIAVYTNACKDYCDREFFTRLGELQGDNKVYVIDNTDPSKHVYVPQLATLCADVLKEHEVRHLNVQADDHKFHHNVCFSVSQLREAFLKSDCDYFLIIESDVIPPKALLEQFDDTIEDLPEDWGIVGALYYEGFHDYNKMGIHQTHHALSGCTVYRREVVECHPFRISEENWGAFPDAWISHDVNQEGKYKIFSDHDIRCDHRQFIGNSRQSKDI